ncbi:MAG: hypothetical protein ACT4OM_13160 [Actinomycetota bacterium]
MSIFFAFRSDFFAFLSALDFLDFLVPPVLATLVLPASLSAHPSAELPELRAAGLFGDGCLSAMVNPL